MRIARTACQRRMQIIKIIILSKCRICVTFALPSVQSAFLATNLIHQFRARARTIALHYRPINFSELLDKIIPVIGETLDKSFFSHVSCRQKINKRSPCGAGELVIIILVIFITIFMEVFICSGRGWGSSGEYDETHNRS